MSAKKSSRRQEIRRILGRGEGRDEGARPGAEGRGTEGRRRGRPAREARRDAGARSRDGRERLHAIVTASAPGLTPKTWYGMPAYAKDGKVLCFFQSAEKFGSRYATFGFSDEANLDDGAMWPTSFALKKLTAADEKRIAALVKQAVKLEGGARRGDWIHAFNVFFHTPVKPGAPVAEQLLSDVACNVRPARCRFPRVHALCGTDRYRADGQAAPGDGDGGRGVRVDDPQLFVPGL